MRNDIYCDADDRRLAETGFSTSIDGEDTEVDPDSDHVEYRFGSIFINEGISFPIFRVNGVSFYED